MSDQTDHQEEQATGKRGEAAWKEARERVDQRNAAARKLGKQRRQAYERGRDEARRAAELRQMAELRRRDNP
jgi:hypothetical protein